MHDHEEVEAARSLKRKLRVVRLAATASFALALLGFIVALGAVVLYPTSDVTRPLVWSGAASFFVFFAVLALSAHALARLRGVSGADRARARSLSLSGGPIGLFSLIWDLRDEKRLGSADLRRKE